MMLDQVCLTTVLQSSRFWTTIFLLVYFSVGHDSKELWSIPAKSGKIIESDIVYMYHNSVVTM